MKEANQVKQLIEAVQAEIDTAKQKPFKVAVLGQTGYGKSSLINALFGTNLKTDPVRPCTKEIEKIEVTNDRGDRLWFYDLPGIGESLKVDKRYIPLYIENIFKADVVLWLFHSDNRSLSFDFQSFSNLMKRIPSNNVKALLSKFTFILSKCDLIAPSPWICAKENNKCFFVPQKDTRSIIKKKCLYVQEYFLRPFCNDLIASTFNDMDFKIKDDRFICDEDQVIFHGFLDGETLNRFKQKHPKYSKIFDRLADNHKVIPCSSYYRLNLYQVINVVINKLGLEAIARFQNFFRGARLEMLDFSKALHFRNFLIMDVSKKQVIFDLINHKFES